MYDYVYNVYDVKRPTTDFTEENFTHINVFSTLRKMLICNYLP